MFENIGRIFTLILLYFGPIVILYLIYIIFKDRKKVEAAEEEAKNYIVLKISVPKNNEKSPLSAEHMFAAIHGIYKADAAKQETIAFEIASVDKSLQFYCHVPFYLKDFIEGQIYAQYPTAEINVAEDYLKEPSPGFSIFGTELKLTKEDVYPIKTFTDFQVDPLAGITGVMSQVDLYDQVAIQVLVRPVDDSWQKKGSALIKSIKTGVPIGGVPFRKMFADEFKKFFMDLLKLAFVKGGESKAEKKEEKLSGPVEEAIKSIETKTKKLGFETKIRVVSICKNAMIAESKVRGLVGTFKQYNTTNLNGFTSEDMPGEEALEKFKLRDFSEEGFILNIEELASLYHFPSVSVETPTIVWSGSKKGEPPSNLPLVETTDPKEITVLGKVYFRDSSHKFGIKIPDRRLHIYSLGKTGAGKSTLFENMIYDDIQEGRGLAVVDPHGDLVEAALNFIPDERINDVVYFNPYDQEHPIGFNLLENVSPDLKNIVASGVVGIFKKIFGESWGPRLEYILRNVILALLDYEGATLLDVTRILVDKGFRSQVIAKVDDPVIRDFFIKEYEQYDPKFRTEAIAPIQNKVGQFLSSTTIRNIVGQAKSTINIEKIMNEQKILLVDLSTGKIGEDNSALLGAMMITKIQMSAMRRVHIPKDQRNNFFLYVDEFQNFATDSFVVILSEARKYGLGLMVTNQYTTQLPENVANAIFGNVGTMICFRVGPGDASVLEKEFSPVFEANDLINLPNYKSYIKMSINGVTSQPFSAAMLPPPEHTHKANREAVIAQSIEKYSRLKSEVEGLIKSVFENSSELVDFSLDNKEYEEPEEVKPIETIIYKVGDQEFKNLKDKKTGLKWFVKKDDYDKFESKNKEKQKKIDEKVQQAKERFEEKRRKEEARDEDKPREDNNIVRRNDEEKRASETDENAKEKIEPKPDQEKEEKLEKADFLENTKKYDSANPDNKPKAGTINPGESIEIPKDYI